MLLVLSKHRSTSSDLSYANLQRRRTLAFPKSGKKPATLQVGKQNFVKNHDQHFRHRIFQSAKTYKDLVIQLCLYNFAFLLNLY